MSVRGWDHPRRFEHLGEVSELRRTLMALARG